MLHLVQGLMNHQCPRLHRGSRSGFVLGVGDSSVGSGKINWNSDQVRCKSLLVHLLILENKIDFQLRKKKKSKKVLHESNRGKITLNSDESSYHLKISRG